MLHEMWGDSIVGFGEYPYKNRSGKENKWMKIGFSPRKQSLTLYIMDGFGEYESLLGDLGPHSTGGRVCKILMATWNFWIHRGFCPRFTFPENSSTPFPI